MIFFSRKNMFFSRFSYFKFLKNLEVNPNPQLSGKKFNFRGGKSGEIKTSEKNWGGGPEIWGWGLGGGGIFWAFFLLLKYFI